ncbi:MAG: hypothetical protein L0G70_01140 [Rubrobacter sp.]|nr:hypothetical protein [Rubrobacter sp.]
MDADPQGVQRRLAAVEEKIDQLRRDNRRGALLRGLVGQWSDTHEAARRGAMLAVYAAEAGDYDTAAGVFRAMGLPESDVWSFLQPAIEANADFADEVFAEIYEPAGIEGE